jgi:hypothetical protein
MLSDYEGPSHGGNPGSNPGSGTADPLFTGIRRFLGAAGQGVGQSCRRLRLRLPGCSPSPAVLPIPGTASAADLEENVAAASLCLDDEEVADASARL